MNDGRPVLVRSYLADPSRVYVSVDDTRLAVNVLLL